MFIPVPYPEIDFDSFKFSGGEMHIRVNNNIDYSKVERVIITHRVNSMDDFMLVMLAKNALHNKGIKEFDLIMPYMPYGRQDRVCSSGDAFSLKVFAMMLNTARFDTIHTIDRHSKVISNVLNYKTKSNTNKQYVHQAVNYINKHDLVLISPDDGARRKSVDLFLSEIRFNNLVCCKKTRNPETGKLSGFIVPTKDLKGKPCIIVDDICDGGGTFLGLAEELKKKNAGDLYLFVTHGIFSKGFDQLCNTFEHIFTTNSIKDLDNSLSDYATPRNWLTQYKIQM